MKICVWVLLSVGVLMSTYSVRAELSNPDLERIDQLVREIVNSKIAHERNRIQTVIPIGTILQFAGSGALPEGYMLCEGQVLPRVPQNPGESDYQTLFATIGTAFTPLGERMGSTFRVPDLRGRTPIGEGQGLSETGAALSLRRLGGVLGAEDHTLIELEMPAHKHHLNDKGHNHKVNDPGHKHEWMSGGGGATLGSTVYARNDAGFNKGAPTSEAYTKIGILDEVTGITMDDAGASQPHNNMQPSLVVRYMIRWK